MSKKFLQKIEKNALFVSIGFVVLLLTTALIIGFTWKNDDSDTINPEASTVSKKEVTLRGKMNCLPRKPGPDGSIMADCVSGFETEKGEYYKLIDPSAENNPNWFESPLYTAQKVEIKGQLENEESKEFKTKGKITLTSFTILEVAKE